ncbi:MAG: Tm-1-like ATP-binding domain-containing protein [Rubrivivax sp.]|nr:Tm-1-like ATP-binding domain-containing protein [Rubrivivax sp.]MDP3610870.1 Tm-1-like ATP-binding domain-containing protein [Rubrivivax sp.]
MAADGAFCEVLDFSLQELANHLGGSVVAAGPGPLTVAGHCGTPHIVAAGAVDTVDVPARASASALLADRPAHSHNRLIASATSAPEPCQRIAHTTAERLARAQGPSCLQLPLRGVEQWDWPGEPLQDPEGLQAFVMPMRGGLDPRTRCIERDAHINDDAFCDAALQVFSAWVADGLVPLGAP